MDLTSKCDSLCPSSDLMQWSVWRYHEAWLHLERVMVTKTTNKIIFISMFNSKHRVVSYKDNLGQYSNSFYTNGETMTTVNFKLSIFSFMTY